MRWEAKEACLTEEVSCALEEGSRYNGEIHSDGSEADLELRWHRNKSIGNWGDIKVFQVNWRLQVKVL